jgi:hypothetical protein
VNRRYAQLSYTSFDAAGTAGGWQVKQTTGELTAPETDVLVSGVRTVFDAVDPLPTYPTPEDCERGPRRLAYGHTPGDAAAYWHTVPAGSDSTGRPGNVFAHVVLDRTPDDDVTHRPIQWWRSPDWVRPYGAAEVARAVLPDQPPAPADVVSAESVLAFVMDTSTWRLGTLCGLLDAVAAAMDGGPRVVLGVRSPETAAQWIGLVSFLMSPGTATRLSFSTFDRADQLPADSRSGQLLTAVPTTDLPAVPDHLVVIDESATLSMGELGGQPHRTPEGRVIPVTPWSVMAQVTLIDPESARVVLDDIGRYAAAAGDRDLHPAWPMAMSVLHRDDFGDARDEANTIIARYSPPGLSPNSPIGQTVSGALAGLVGTSTADAWHAVTQVSDGRAAEYADVVYLSRAIADPTWLTQPTMIPVGPRGHDGRPVPTELSAAIGPALDRAAAEGPEPLVRLVDLLLRAGIDDPRLSTALTGPAVGGVLSDAHTGGELAWRLGERISWVTKLMVAAETLLVSGPGTNAMTPLADFVVQWFAEGITVPAPPELGAAQPWDQTWTRAAVRGASAQRFGAAHAGDQFAQLWWLRLCGAPQFESLAGGAIWAPDELRAAAANSPLSATATLPTLLGAPNSAGMDELATSVMDTSPDLIASACAAVRAIDPRVWVQQGYIEAHQAEYTPLWQDAVDIVGLAGVHPDFGTRLLTLSVVANVSGKPYPAASALLAADQLTADAAVDTVIALVDQQVLVPAAVLAASLVPQTDERSAGPAGGVDGVVSTVAQHLVTTREFSDDDVDTAVSMMAAMTGLDAAEAPRKYRKMVHKLLSAHAEGHSSLAARIKGGR